jgi:hypothetical protein
MEGKGQSKAINRNSRDIIECQIIIVPPIPLRLNAV